MVAALPTIKTVRMAKGRLVTPETNPEKDH